MGTRKGPNHSPPDNLSPDFKKRSTIPNILGVVLTLFLKRKSADLKKKERERKKKAREKKKARCVGVKTTNFNCIFQILKNAVYALKHLKFFSFWY